MSDLTQTAIETREQLAANLRRLIADAEDLLTQRDRKSVV